MRKRGFTLVELLGVIVVLGVLTSIVTISILKIIDNSDRDAALRSAEQLIKAATLDYTTNDTFTTEKKDVLSFDYEGEKPESGYIQFNENEKVRLYMVRKGYCVVKRYDSELDAIKMKDIDICDWYTSPNTVREESTDTLITSTQLSGANLLNYKIYGNSYQETRSGKNLLNLKNVANIQHTSVESGDNIIVVKANVEEKVPIVTIFNQVLPVGTYTISLDFTASGTNTGSRPNELMIFKNNAYYTLKKLTSGENNSLSFEVTEDNTTISISFYVNVASTTSIDYEAVLSNIQLEEGSSATEYEAYGVMPSPDYPSEIKSLGTLVTDGGINDGKYKIDINVTGKNLFDVNNANVFNGYIGEDKLNVYGPVVDTTASLAIRIKPNTTYTVSRKILGERFRIATAEIEPGSDVSFTNMVSGYTNQYLTITSGARDKYLYVWFYNSSYDSNSYLELMDEIQIEEGSTATEYEPYIGETTSIYLDEPLRCIGEVCDYIDYENKTVVRNIEIVELDGINKMAFKNDELSSTYTYYNLTKHFKGSVLSTHFINISYFPSESKSYGKIYSMWNTDTLFMNGYGIVSSDNATNSQGNTEFNNWLKSQKTAGNPLIIQYQLLTSMTEKIDLPEIKTIEGINYMTVTDGDLNASKVEIVATKK